MIDSRIYTFLKLCELMNYHKTAQALHMTQPAVSQHIKHLELQYGCKLFTYNARELVRTSSSYALEGYSRSAVNLDMGLRLKLSGVKALPFRVGVTKTIGEYEIEEMVTSLVKSNEYDFSLVVDNTENLFKKLNNFELDCLMLEGYFDKKYYDYQKIATKEVLGICGKNHKFAGKAVLLEQIFSQHLLLRENGSGTRAVFVNYLHEQNCNISQFEKVTEISSCKLIERTLEQVDAITFAYDVVAKNNQNLKTFTIKCSKIMHDFNYVYFKKSTTKDILQKLHLADNQI